MNIDVDLMLTVTAGVLLARVIYNLGASVLFACFGFTNNYGRKANLSLKNVSSVAVVGKSGTFKR